ncbi:MAG: calcium-binding protein, partial [Chromatiales bacterium]
RNALVNLTPFVVKGDDAFYARCNANEELDLYDPKSRTGNLTEQYLRDRAHFLEALTTYNLADTTSVTGHNLIEYWDLGTGESVTRQATSDHVSQRNIFGTEESDEIKGGDDDDHLYGEGGDDKLTGLAGADYMEGGEGDDSYIAGDGDILYDSDGFGRVIFGDDVLHGGVSNDSQTVFTSRDGKVGYTLTDDTLTVTGEAGELTIQNFKDGDLGIFLERHQPQLKRDALDKMEGEPEKTAGQQARENLGERAAQSEQLHPDELPQGKVTCEESRCVIDMAAQNLQLMVREAAELKRDFRGEVVASSTHHALVKISDMVAISYEKASLDRDLQLGEKVAIQYSNDMSQVNEHNQMPVREPGKDLAHEISGR